GGLRCSFDSHLLGRQIVILHSLRPLPCERRTLACPALLKKSRQGWDACAPRAEERRKYSNQSLEARGLFVLESFERYSLVLDISPVAHNQSVEINLMRVELGPIHARESSLAADDYAASAAHPGAVDHHRIQA